MNLENMGTIAEKLKPTFENVTREFVTDTLYEILFSEKTPNFRFDFREKEAIDFIGNILKDYTDKFEFYENKAQQILQKIKEKNFGNTIQPVMVVNNHKKFFELLRQYYERDIELYFLRTKMSGFPVYEKENCFKEVWLRATPEDFNDPEKFLKKQVDMICDNTLQKYDKETYLGKWSLLDDNIICIKNGIARTWDETSRQFEIMIYDKKYYNQKELMYKPCYKLPVIRYGIYKKDGKKICHIASIQNKNDDYEKNELNKKIDRKKYKVNDSVLQEETCQVEPKNVLSLSIFINILNMEGISEIEVPSMFVLDYEYHKRKNKTVLENFQQFWSKDKIQEYPDDYRRSKYFFNKSYKKEDLISQIKTERLQLLFRRILVHYPNGNIKSYPGEADSLLHLNIPIVKSENEINGKVLKELYNMVKSKHLENER